MTSSDISQVAFSARTDVGMKRSHNQDSHSTQLASGRDAWETRGHVFMVADGMGAHAVGELASKLAVDTFRLVYARSREPDGESALRKAISDANDVIHTKGTQNPEFKGMGTTATALRLSREGALIGHVGDSRCYRIRGPFIEQLTFDHSLQWEMARKQKTTPDRIKSVPSNVIVRSLGPEPKVKVDVTGPYSTKSGDRFLLCSDGLSGCVSDQEMWAVASHLPVDAATQCLVDLANLRGGMDNITVILAQVGDSESGLSDSERGPSFFRRCYVMLRDLPLSWWFLAMGCTASAAGYWLAALGMPFALYLLLAAVVLLVGSVAGTIDRWLRRHRQPIKEQPSPPPVFRSSSCQVDRDLVDRFANSEQTLRETAIEQHWKVDWAVLGRIRNEANTHLNNNDFPRALVSLCEGIMALSADFRMQRERSEVFKPTWETRRN